MMRRQSVQILEQVVTNCVTPNGGMYRMGPSILFIYSVSRSVLKNLWELCGKAFAISSNMPRAKVGSCGEQ